MVVRMIRQENEAVKSQTALKHEREKGSITHEGTKTGFLITYTVEDKDEALDVHYEVKAKIAELEKKHAFTLGVLSCKGGTGEIRIARNTPAIAKNELYRLLAEQLGRPLSRK